MARTKGNSSPARYKWLGHVQHHFNDSEKTECLKWLLARELVPAEVIDIIVQKDIGIKITYSQAQDGYNITLQTKDRQSPYYGYTVGVAHEKLERGIGVALYVVDVLMDNQAIDLPEKQKYMDW